MRVVEWVTGWVIEGVGDRVGACAKIADRVHITGAMVQVDTD